MIIIQGGGYKEFVIKKDSILLLCGAGLLPEEFISNYKIINAHPGYIPNARGLDAYKWAIIENNPIGVTTHLLGKEVDAGEIIERRIVSIKYSDTFHSVAWRVYENEIDMLVSAIEKTNEPHEYIGGGNYVIHRRMPHNIELRLFEKFEQRRKEAPIDSV